MARVFISDSHKDEARKDRRTAAREQTHIPRSLFSRTRTRTRTGLSRDRNQLAKARTLIAQCEYFCSVAHAAAHAPSHRSERTHHEPKSYPDSSGCSASY